MAVGLGTAVAYLNLDASGFARGIDGAISDAKRLNTGFQNVSNTATRVGGVISGFGSVLTAGITAPIAGFGAAAIKSGADFDKSMSDVKAVSMSTQNDMNALSKAAEELGVSYKKGTSDADTAFNALRATAIKMGNDTKFTAKESADALYYMGLAGWSADQMIAGIPGVLSLASAGNTELARTSDIVTDAITGFGHSAEETATITRNGFNKEIPIATRLADIMASTMANSNTDVDLLGESFKYVSPIAGSFGYSMEDVSLSLGLMANAGIKASQAGTTLRQGLKRLIAPTDDAQAAMDKYGYTAADAEGNIKPLRQQISELRDIFGDLDIEVTKSDGTMKTSEEIMAEYGKRLPVTQQEKLSDAVKVFGTTALPGMLALMGASQDSFDDLAFAIDNSSAAFVLHNGEVMTYADAVKRYGEEIVTTSEAFEVLGSAEGMSLIQLDNLQGDWTLFMSALGTAKQIVSDMANGALRDFVQSLTDLVRKFNEMDPEQQKHIVKLGLMAAAVGPVTIAIGKLITTIGKMQNAFSKVSEIIPKLANALSGLLNKFISFNIATGGVETAFNNISGNVPSVISSIENVSSGFSSMADEAANTVKATENVATGFSNAIPDLHTFASEILDANGNVIGFSKVVEEASDEISTGFELATVGATGLSDEVINLGTKSIGMSKETSTALSTIDTGFSAAAAGAASFADDVIWADAVVVDAGASASATTSSVNGLGAAFSTIAIPVAVVVAAIALLVAAFVHLMRTNEDFREKVISMFSGLGDRLSVLFKRIVDAVNSLGFNFKDIADLIHGAWDGLSNLLAPILLGIVKMVTKAIGSIAKTVTGIIEIVLGVVGVIKGIITGDGEQIKKSLDVLLRGISDAFFGIVQLILSPVLGLFETINNIFGTKLPTTFKGFKEAAIGIFNSIVDKFGQFVDFVNSMPDRVRGGIEGVKKFFSNLGKSISNSFKNIKNVVSNWVKSVDNGFSQLPSKVQKGIHKFFITVARIAVYLAKQADQIRKKFVLKVQEFFEDLPYKIGKVIGTIFGTVAKFVIDLDRKANEIGDNFVKAVIKFFKELPGNIKSVLSKVFTNVGNWTSSMIKKAKEVGSKFIDNVVSFFKKLPGKVSSFTKPALSKVSSWGSNIVKKGKETGSKFIENTINFFKQLPGKSNTYLTNTITKAANFVTKMVVYATKVGKSFVINVIKFFNQLPGRIQDVFIKVITNVVRWVQDMGTKGREGARSLIDNFKSAASNVGSAVSSIGRNIVQGVWNGIKRAAGWFKSQVSSFFNGMVDGVKGALGIHSPSTVFEKQVGLNIVLGVAKGILDNASKATNAANIVMSKVVKITGKAYDKAYANAKAGMEKIQKKIESVHKKISDTTDKSQKARLKKQLSNFKTQLKNQRESLAQLQSDYLEYCERQLSQESELYGYSNKQIVQYWKNVRSHLKKGTDAYKVATEKIVESQISMYANMVSEADDALSRMKEQRDVSLKEQIAYWENVKSKCLVGSKAYQDAADKVNAANKELADGIAAATKTLEEGFASATESVKTSVQDIVNSYNDAVASTKSTLMGISGLFESFSIDESISTQDLLDNLQTQVTGLEQWNAVIDKMFARGLPTDLIDELQAMGPKAMGSMVNLLNMTDEQLSQYIALWERKNEEAQQAAIKMTNKETYVNQIKDVIAEAGNTINGLVMEYTSALQELGESTATSAEDISASFVKRFTDSVKKDISDMDFGFFGDAFTSERFSDIGVKMSVPINEALISSLQKAVETAVETINEEAPVVEETLQETVDEENVDVSGYVDVGKEVVGNITTGVKTDTPILQQQATTTGIQSQDSFISAVKSKEPEVRAEGYEIGKALDEGMASGINDYVGTVVAAAVAAVQAAIAAARAAAAIGSPSKKMADMVGKWLPLGMAKGFVDSTPEATKQMQDAVDESLDSLNARDFDLFPNVKSVGEEVKDAFHDISEWFGNVSDKVSTMTETMKEKIQDVVDITDGMLYNIYDSENSNLNTMISGKNVKWQPIDDGSDKDGKDKPPVNGGGTSNTFIFNSPKPIDEVQASRLIRQTSRDLAEGFA